MSAEEYANNLKCSECIGCGHSSGIPAQELAAADATSYTTPSEDALTAVPFLCGHRMCSRCYRDVFWTSVAPLLSPSSSSVPAAAALCPGCAETAEEDEDEARDEEESDAPAIETPQTSSASTTPHSEVQGGDANAGSPLVFCVSCRRVSRGHDCATCPQHAAALMPVPDAARSLRDNLGALGALLAAEFDKLGEKRIALTALVDRMCVYDSQVSGIAASHPAVDLKTTPSSALVPHLVDVLDSSALINEECDALIRLIEARRSQLHAKVSRTVSNASAALEGLRAGVEGALAQRTTILERIEAAKSKSDLDLCESYGSIMKDVGRDLHDCALEGMLRASMDPKVLMQFNSWDLHEGIAGFGHIANRPMAPLLFSVSNVVLGKVLLRWGAIAAVGHPGHFHLGGVVSPAAGADHARTLRYDVEIVVSNDDVLSGAFQKGSGSSVSHKFRAGEVIQIGTFGSDVTEKCFDVLAYGGHHVFFRVSSVDVNSGARSPWCESEMIHVPRSFSKEFKHVHDKDSNGILYWLATNGQVEGWRNPHTMGHVNVTKLIPEAPSGHIIGNSPSGAFVRSRPHAVVGHRSHRDLQAPVVAVPSNDEHFFVERPDYGLDANGFPRRMRCCTSSGTDGAWICIDFGPHKRVHARRYCLGFDSHVNHLAVRWVLEGANDSQGPWTLLHEHVAKDLSTVFDTHESQGSWEVSSGSSSSGDQEAAFRYFRVHQASTHSSTSAGFRGRPALSCTGFELYGNMIVAPSF